MTREDSISVVVAAWNAATFLSETIDSFLKQHHREFELIVVDDASTDATPDIVQRYSDSRVRLIRLEKNVGAAAAGQLGIEASNGDWIARSDADDTSLPHRLNTQLKVSQLLGGNRIIGSSVVFFGEKTGFGVRRITQPQLQAQLPFVNPLIHSSLFGARSTFLGCPYDPLRRHAEDHDLIERMSRSGVKMFNIPAPLVKYRVRGDSKSRSNRNERRIEMHKIYSRFLKDFSLETDERQLDLYYSLAMLDAALLPRGATMPELRDLTARLVVANDEKRFFPRWHFRQVVASRSSKLIAHLKR